MSYNQNYANCYTNVSTFQNMFFPPPPLPPPLHPAFFHQPSFPLACPPPILTDEEIVKNIEKNLVSKKKIEKSSSVSISHAQKQLKSIVKLLNFIKSKETLLTINVESMSEDDWISNLNEIEEAKKTLNESLAKVNDDYLDALRKKIDKRSAKRLRLKRMQMERKKEKAEKRQELAERSRKIDENLQKIQRECLKIKQEEELKLESDIILRDVSKQKSDAKKHLKRLDALTKLYKARQTTAKGRGEAISDSNASAFDSKIEKLKSLWSYKLSLYEKEESRLLAQLAENNKKLNTKAPSIQEQEVVTNLKKWQSFLFGDGKLMPQRDFKGNLDSFVAVRSLWDQYISDAGTSLPIGWVLPDG